MSDLEELARRTKEGDRAAAEALVVALQDGVYKLALRMLGQPSEAEDATQEILLQALTHLSEFRGESALRTWVWRIAVRHLQRAKRGRREEIASFEMLEELIARGEGSPAPPALAEGELALLATEVKLSCTQGMLLSLERDHRISWILAEVFDLSSDEAADVLGIDAATHRKRLARARDRLAAWMSRHCGLVSKTSPCRCARQIPVALEAGVVDAKNLTYASHPRRASPRALRVLDEASEIEAASAAIRRHPDYAAPGGVARGIRALIASGRYQVFDA